MLNKSIWKFLTALSVVSLIVFCTTAQDIILTGKVLDEVTNEPVPFCNVLTSAIDKGTFTNEEGEFLLKVDSLPVNLIISNIAYKPKTVQILSQGRLIFHLEPASTVLQEIVIKDKKMDKFAIGLVKGALDRTIRSSVKPHFGKAFYRQKSQNDSAYVELMEIFYDVKFNSNGILDWEVQEGRYAQREDQLLNRNFTLLSRIFPVIQPLTTDLYLPLLKDTETIFDLYLSDIIEVDDHKIGIVTFTPKEGISRPCFTGDLYIDIDTHDVLKVDGSFRDDHLPIIRLTDKKGSFKNLNIKYETAFKRDSLDNILLDYVKFDQKFDYYIDGVFMYPVHSQSFLTFYEYYKPLRKNKKLGGRLKYKNNDRDILDLVGYDSRFWQDNSIVKRTPVEEAVINSFEKDEAFGTIYLNSLEQIALNETDIGNELFLQDMLLKVKNYQYNSPVEKVYLHFDKPYYASGQKMWFAAYAVHANGLYLSGINRVLHVDFLGPRGKSIETQKIELSQGLATGQLVIPKDLPSGTYLIRAYTQWMRNHPRDFYFNKKINIYNAREELSAQSKPENNTVLPDPEIDLQFFPEGGHAVYGITSQIAFKAIGKDGKARAIEGTIIDETGKALTFFKSAYKGMGLFYLKPEKGHRYQALLKGSAITYDLPVPLDSGYTLLVKNNHQKSIKVRVQASPELHRAPFYLIGQSRNNVYFRQKYHMENGMVNLEIPKNQLPSGIFTLTLFDIDKKPRAERVVFVNTESEFNVDFQLQKIPMKGQEEVRMRIFTQDEEGRPVRANISLAVTDAGQVLRDKNQSHLLSQLLLESDLKGFIENPGYFFVDPSKSKRYSLDLVMMTHGWRKFPWLEVLKKGALSNYWAPEKGISIKGAISDPYTKEPMVDHEVVLLSINENSNFSAVSRTDNFGIFSIEGLLFNMYDNLIFKVVDERGRVVPAHVVWEQEKRPLSNFNGGRVYADKEVKSVLGNELIRQQNDDVINAEYLLEEVTVQGSRMNDNSSGLTNAVVISPEKISHAYTNILRMIADNVPGIRAIGTGANTALSIDGRGTPLVIVNGLELNGATSGRPANVAGNQATGRLNDNVGLSVDNINGPISIGELVGWMKPADVESIEVLKRFNAAAYGSKGRNGVIIINTKDNKEGKRPKLRDRNVVYIQEKGFEPVKTFYQPKYVVKDSPKGAVKHSALIYWLPSITTDKNGNADVSFYLPAETSMQVVVEGISQNGKPGVAFEVIKD
ncbi:MAG: carboxypeptidase-like regulatory domain-containing protein [Cytophagales bacterium]|nr:carboxypeptidase-like regulatory domain-containing protein [Cytophagales bacterium]